jgi:hypothetical protein
MKLTLAALLFAASLFIGLVSCSDSDDAGTATNFQLRGGGN